MFVKARTSAKVKLARLVACEGGGEAWCLKESMMEILRKTETHSERKIWSTAQR